jgi:hypothetical protein
LELVLTRYTIDSAECIAAYYESNLGFSIDWGGEDGGIAGISRGQCRMFLTNRAFREQYANTAPVLIWLNLGSKEEVNELYDLWCKSHAKMVSAPESNRGACMSSRSCVL